ncbi:MAG: HD domain-containing phosphohydrolase [Alkalispirochaeta sp.]
MNEQTPSRILIVDDDHNVRKSLVRLVASYGCTVFQSESGEQALAILEQESIDTVLLDIRMPGMGGMATLERIAAMDTTTPVIMVTATDEIETAVRCLRRGAFDYVIKPVRKIVLREAIARSIQHRVILQENRRLAEENARHQAYLEEQVELRTSELRAAYDQMERNNFETVRVLAETIEAKDSYTRGHCNRVHLLSSTLAKHLNFATTAVTAIEYGALLHDIGKIGVPESILNKPGALADEEFRILKRHPEVGEQILRPLAFFADCLPIVRNHHERYDGTGYPDGIGGDDITPSARVVAIADAFDAMTSNRSYRTAMSFERALERIESGSGTQFDPEFTREFLDRRVFESVLEI